MKLHPLLSEPNAVVISHTPLGKTVCWEDYRRAAAQLMAALQVTLEGEKAVIKPNVTAGERFANPDSGIGTHPAFVRGLVDYLHEHGARRSGIYILEDPRDTDDNRPRHWRGTGYCELAAETGAQLRCPTKCFLGNLAFRAGIEYHYGDLSN